VWLTNTANTRVFNVTFPGARMKQVGGDSGRVEHEEFVDRVVLAPSERVVVDMLVESPGELALERHTPDRTYRLAAITVTEGAPSTAATRFAQLRRAAERDAKRAQLEPWLSADPAKILALVAQMDDPAAMPPDAGQVTYACPMHPGVKRGARPLPRVRHETARYPGPSTATELLERILARDDAARSATTLQREQYHPAVRLADAAGHYVDAL
jgi:FtsP/CotA-like multicopper oxidase with cupredoxin domain